MAGANHDRDGAGDRFNHGVHDCLALIDAEFGRLAQHAQDRQTVSADFHLKARQFPETVVIDRVIGMEWGGENIEDARDSACHLANSYHLLTGDKDHFDLFQRVEIS